ncbi:unnamed protein product [Mucor hiemalis]
MNSQTSACDIPTNKTTHITATTTPDGHTMMSSIVTDEHGQQLRRNSACADTGISPTYYTTTGSVIHTSRQEDVAHSVGSPVFDDKSRIFFSHNSACICRGSGVGCDCSSKCAC